MRWLRTWLPIAIIASGLVLIAIVRNESGLEGGTLLISAGLSVWLLNWFYRVGVRGDRDRVTEDEARTFFDRHGYWPDEAPRAEPGSDAPVPERPETPHRRRPPGDRFDRPGTRRRRPGP
jgi:hypothetical protein